MLSVYELREDNECDKRDGSRVVANNRSNREIGGEALLQEAYHAKD